MEKRLELIEDAVIGIREELKVLAVNSATQNAQLKEHMRRTAAVEEQNELLRELVKVEKNRLDKRIKPLEVFVDRAKFLGAVAGVAGTIVMALKQLGLLTISL